MIEDVTTLPQGVDTQVFCYDDLARLTWAGSTGTPACSGAPTPADTGSLAGSSAAYSATYAYDTMNRLTASPLGSYSYGDSAHADAATAIGGTAWSASYDAAGNTLCRAATSATTCAGTQTGAQLGYDNQGQLASWQNTSSSPTSTDRFLYDGEGNRVEQVATSGGATTTTTYVGGLEEISTTGATTTTTAYYGGLALSVNGTLSYTLSDGLGSVSEAVGADGTTIVTQLYGPYGSVRYQSGSLPTSYGYTGQRADGATGLDYYGARYYDPVTGQLTSADTTLLGGPNRYAYVDGNPETLVDPTGHRPGACENSACAAGIEEELRGGASPDASGGVDAESGGGGTGSGTDGAAGAPQVFAPPPFAWEPSSITAFGVVAFLTVAGIFAIGTYVWNAFFHAQGAHSPTSPSGVGSGTGSGNGSGNPPPPPPPPSPTGNGVTVTPTPPTPPQPNPNGAGATSGGGGKVCGGAYDAVPKNGGENHHMPSDKFSPFSRGKGPVINMSIADHRQTASWGPGTAAKAYRGVQQALIQDGLFEEAQRMDIENVRALFGAKYDDAIDQMLQYTQDLLCEE